MLNHESQCLVRRGVGHDNTRHEVRFTQVSPMQVKVSCVHCSAELTLFGKTQQQNPVEKAYANSHLSINLPPNHNLPWLAARMCVAYDAFVNMNGARPQYMYVSLAVWDCIKRYALNKHGFYMDSDRDLWLQGTMLCRSHSLVGDQVEYVK